MAQSLKFPAAGDKLAPPSANSDILGIDRKDRGDIELWFTGCLAAMRHDGLEITLENLKKFNHLPGKTIFQAEGVQFFVEEAKPINNSLMYVMVRRKDARHGLRTYYAVFSNRPSDTPPAAHVFTKKEFDASKEFTKGLPERNALDTEAIERYKEHEEKVDVFWAEKLKKEGEYVICDDATKGSLLFRFFLLQENLINLGMERANAELIMNAIRERRLIFVHATAEELPKIQMKDKDGVPRSITVHSHSSNNAIWMALGDRAWEDFKDLERMIKNPLPSDPLLGDPFNLHHPWFRSLFVRFLFHEIGAICGLKAIAKEKSSSASRNFNKEEFPEDYVVSNLFDEVLELGGRTRSNYEWWEKVSGSFGDQLKDLKPVDLDTNLDERDYAAGATESVSGFWGGRESPQDAAVHHEDPKITAERERYLKERAELDRLRADVTRCLDEGKFREVADILESDYSKIGDLKRIIAAGAGGSVEMDKVEERLRIICDVIKGHRRGSEFLMSEEYQWLRRGLRSELAGTYSLTLETLRAAKAAAAAAQTMIETPATAEELVAQILGTIHVEAKGRDSVSGRGTHVVFNVRRIDPRTSVMLRNQGTEQESRWSVSIAESEDKPLPFVRFFGQNIDGVRKLIDSSIRLKRDGAGNISVISIKPDDAQAAQLARQLARLIDIEMQHRLDLYHLEQHRDMHYEANKIAIEALHRRGLAKLAKEILGSEVAITGGRKLDVLRIYAHLVGIGPDRISAEEDKYRVTAIGEDAYRVFDEANIGGRLFKGPGDVWQWCPFSGGTAWEGAVAAGTPAPQTVTQGMLRILALPTLQKAMKSKSGFFTAEDYREARAALSKAEDGFFHLYNQPDQERVVRKELDRLVEEGYLQTSGDAKNMAYNIVPSHRPEIEAVIGAAPQTQPREKDGTFTYKHGGKPEDAEKVIALEESLQRARFTLRQYLASQRKARERYTQLGFEPISKSTARRDLKNLCDRGILVRHITAKGWQYQLTEIGHAVITGTQISLYGKGIANRDMLERRIDEVWDRAGAQRIDDLWIHNPFSKDAQAAFKEINRAGQILMANKLATSVGHFHKICYAALFGEADYQDMFGFFKAVQRLPAEAPVRQYVRNSRSFLILYSVARMLDPDSVDTWYVDIEKHGKSLVAYYAERFFGSEERIPNTLGRTAEERSQFENDVYKTASEFIDFYTNNGMYDNARDLANSLLTFIDGEKVLHPDRKAELDKETYRLWGLRPKIQRQADASQQPAPAVVPEVTKRADNREITDGPQEEEEVAAIEASPAVEGMTPTAAAHIAEIALGRAAAETTRLPSEAYMRSAEELQKTIADDNIKNMTDAAKATGLDIPTHTDERYTLLVTSEFFANGELNEHRARYGARFDLDAVSGMSPEQFVVNVLAKANGKEARTVALLPNDLPQEQLARLISAGIRFVPTDVNELRSARANRDGNRAQFQQDTYAVMLLVRRIDKKITKDSSIYRLLSFYLKSHFALTDKIAVEDYINAILNSDIAKLIKGYLMYRPIEAYDAPEYKKVAETLMSA